MEMQYQLVDLNLPYEETNMTEEEEEQGEDMISNLPNDVLQYILAPFDLKHIVQTCLLSRGWERVWTSAPNLVLHSSAFPKLPMFAKFVKQVLARRNHQVDVSKVVLTYTGAGKPYVVGSIARYAYLHGAREFNMTWRTKKYFQFPLRLFYSRTLKHLTLETNEQTMYPHKNSCIPHSTWELPALETVVLIGMHLGDHGEKSLDLFSKCGKLKKITLHNCCMYGIHIFYIYAPQLSDLTITSSTSFPLVFMVFAPKLQNFTASVRATIDRAPSIFDSLQILSEEGFDSLNKVDVHFSMPHREQARFVPLLLNLFNLLGSTKYLVINRDIIEALTLGMHEVEREACPFKKLKAMRINMAPVWTPSYTQFHVRNYFLKHCPNAIVTTDLPQLVPGRPREEVDDATVANKVARLNAGENGPSSISQAGTSSSAAGSSGSNINRNV